MLIYQIKIIIHVVKLQCHKNIIKIKLDFIGHI